MNHCEPAFDGGLILFERSMKSFEVRLERPVSGKAYSTVIVDAESEAEAIRQALDAAHGGSIEWSNALGDKTRFGAARVVSVEAIVDLDDA